MSRHRHYLLNGHEPVPVTWRVWAEYFDWDTRTVAQTEVGGFLISTVFLGLDCNFSDRGPALLFETMVFRLNPDGDPGFGEELAVERYGTWPEAEAGHARHVLAVRERSGV